MRTMFAVYSATVFLLSITCTHADPPMQAHDMKMCENKVYPFQLKDIKLRIKDDTQELKMKVILNNDVTDEYNYVITVDRFIGTKSKKIINMKNKGPCSALIQYGGETFLGGVKQAKFPHPDRCPLEKGTYTLDWYKINFDAIPLVKLVPKGKFLLTIQMMDPNSGKDLFCLNISVDKN